MLTAVVGGRAGPCGALDHNRGWGWGGCCREVAWGLKLPLEQEQESGTGRVGNSQACCSAASVEAFLFWCALGSCLCECMGVVVSLSNAQGIPIGPALCRVESLSFLLGLLAATSVVLRCYSFGV